MCEKYNFISSNSVEFPFLQHHGHDHHLHYHHNPFYLAGRKLTFSFLVEGVFIKCSLELSRCRVVRHWGGWEYIAPWVPFSLRWKEARPFMSSSSTVSVWTHALGLEIFIRLLIFTSAQMSQQPFALWACFLPDRYAGELIQYPFFPLSSRPPHKISL